MTTQDQEGISPQSLINIKPVTAAVKEFFGSSQLSQFMDVNVLAGRVDIRDVFPHLDREAVFPEIAPDSRFETYIITHGRMCPIETPEGPNIGLINSLATYARINQYGFVEALSFY